MAFVTVSKWRGAEKSDIKTAELTERKQTRKAVVLMHDRMERCSQSPWRANIKLEFIEIISPFQHLLFWKQLCVGQRTDSNEIPFSQLRSIVKKNPK